MMTYPHHVARPLILRARRDTIGLIAAATMSTFALAHVVQSHRIAMAPDGPRQVWTGGLVGVAPDALFGASEPLTSASLVVPEAELALPQAPMRALVKLRGCADGVCTSRPTSRTAAVPLPPRKFATEKPVAEQVANFTDSAVARREKQSLISRLNPLDHLPTHLPGHLPGHLPYASTIKRPFVYASDAVSGWFKHF